MDLNQTIGIVPLLGYELHKRGSYSVGMCPFCGGRDRFTVKHTSAGDRWHCRHCGDGKYHTVIDYVMRRDQCSFQAAAQTLSGDALRGGVAAIRPQPQTHARPQPIPSADWQLSAWRIVDAASDALFRDTGQAGRDYLLGRGLSRGTWQAWHLGIARVYDPQAGRSRDAIVLPWTTKADREIIAIKYRFMDNEPAGLRYISARGSMPTLFGGWDVIGHENTLLLVEGEINALSLWQCRPRGVAVLSFGGETNGRAETLLPLTTEYQNIFIWCDEAQRSKDYETMLSRPCQKL
jgi:DNA primase